MAYVYEDQSIIFDAEKGINFINNTIDSDISDICKKINSLSQSLSDLQKVAYDRAGTAITEDYKDMESLIGDGSNGTGIIGFSKDIYNVTNSMLETLKEIDNITSYRNGMR